MLSLTGITPADSSQLLRETPLAFTLTTDLPSAVGVMVSIYLAATDTEEMAWDGLQFVGHYATVSVKSGDDFLLRRRSGWPVGSIALRVRELGSVTVMSVWTDGTGVPNNGVGNDGDYYLDTASGEMYKRSGGTYSSIYTPTAISSAAPTIGIGSGNTEGVASTYALSDHNHTIRTGATDLTVGTVTDGEFLKRVGTEIVSAEAGGGGVADLISVLSADHQLAAIESYTPVFPPAQDRVTVAADTTYFLEARLAFMFLAGGNGGIMSMRFDGGTATYTSFDYYSHLVYGNWVINVPKASQTDVSTVVSQASSTDLCTSAFVSMRTMVIKGVVRVNASGTFFPEVKFTSMPVGATLPKGCYFRLTPFGNGSVIETGGWS